MKHDEMNPHRPLTGMTSQPERRSGALAAALMASSLLILAGCAVTAGPTGSRPLPDGATLTIQPLVRSGSYRSQSVVHTYDQSDVSHLQIKIFKWVNNADQPILGPDGAQLMVDLPPASLSAPVTFTNLNRSTTYMVRGYAYADAGTSRLISDVVNGSTLQISLTFDDRPYMLPLTVNLVDTVFGAQATISTGVNLTNGVVTSSGSVGVGTSYTVDTLAGVARSPGSTNGTGTAARFNVPGGIAADGVGNLYVADTNNNVIRKITSAGVVTTLAGIVGVGASLDGTGTAARFNYPAGIAVDAVGNVYVADTSNCTIRKITSAGVVTTLAGTGGFSGTTDATGSAARFAYPAGIAVDGSGSLYVADTNNKTIRKITSAGAVTTLAGTAGSPGSADGTGTAATFSNPKGVAVDSAGNVFVADTGNHLIRMITPSGVVTTLAGSAGTSGSLDGTGTAATFNSPYGLAVDGGGNVYVADTSNSTIRKITSAGVVTTLAGTAGANGSDDGTGHAATFFNPRGVAVNSAGSLFVVDTARYIIRRLQ